MTEPEKHYAYFLFKGYSQFADLMKGNAPQAHFEIPEEARYRIAGYVRRTIKK